MKCVTQIVKSAAHIDQYFSMLGGLTLAKIVHRYELYKDRGRVRESYSIFGTVEHVRQQPQKSF